MRRFLSGVLALFICFTSIVPAFATSNISSEPVLQTWLNEGQEWFCEKHNVLKSTPPSGTEQFCIYCQRETSVFASDPNGSDTFIDVHAFNSYSGGDYTRSPCPTFSGADGLVIYGVPSDYGLTMNMGYTQVGLVFNFSAPWQPRDLYNGASLSFYYGAALVHGEPDNHDFKIMTDPYYNRAAPDPIDLYKDNAFCLASTESVKDFNSKYISDWAAFHSFGTSMDSTFASSSDGRTVWMVIGLCPPGVPPHTVRPSARDFYFTAPYIDPDGGTTLQPGDSGFDILGGIFEMIKKILESIMNLPSKIADAVKGFFTALGNQISGAINSMFEGIKGLWNDDSHHNNEVDNAISGLEQQDQQLGTVEDQILGDFTSQGSQLDTVMDGLTFPVGMSSAMTWITLQVNNMWSGLGADIRLVFTFSFVLGLALIFLGRWRA